jgi:hypothetical protein
LVAGGIVLSAAAVFAGYLFQGFGDPPSATPLAHADSLPGGSNDPENCQTSEGFLAGDESESSALPGFDHVEGAFLVKDVRTLVVKNRLVKLAGVGIGEPDSAERLRMWLAANASTVACVPVDLRRCEYSCNAGSGNNDIATRILESRWASPSR